jgi:phage terminase small subunit
VKSAAHTRSPNLNRRQARFVEEYLVDLSATQAAIRAGYSKKTAKEMGAENLTKPHIALAIEEAMKERGKRTEIEADRVLQEIARLAFSDIRNVFQPDGRLRAITELDDATAAAVASVKVVSRDAGIRPDGTHAIEYVHEIKMTGKDSSLDKLMRHLGEYEQDNRQRSPLANLPRADVQKIAEHLAKLARGGD